MVNTRGWSSSHSGSHQNVGVVTAPFSTWTGRVGVFVAAFTVVLVGWAVSTPVGSSPDDDYHLSSIWCAQGERAGLCEIYPQDAMSRLVPKNVFQAHACYAFDPMTNASCASELTGVLVATTRVNETAQLYPNGYYRAMSIFSGHDPASSVVAIRLINIVIAAGALLGGLLLAPRGIARSSAIAVLVGYVPMGLYIVPSTNPSSWAITGIVTLWVFGLSLLLMNTWRRRRTWMLAAGSVLGAVLAMSARLDAAVYVGITVVVIFIIAGLRRIRQQWQGALVLVTLSVMGLVVFFTTEPPVAPGGEALGTSDRGIGLLLTNIVNAPVYLQQALGGPLGWYDINLPTWVPIVGTLALGFIIYRQLALGPSRVFSASIVAFAVVLAVPIAFLQLGGLVVGELVQPRYFLPLLIIFIATANLGSRIRTINPWPAPAALVLVFALTVSAVLSFWYTAHRYAAGLTRGLFDTKLVIDWSGLTSVPWIISVAITVVATIIMYAVGFRFFVAEPRESVR